VALAGSASGRQPDVFWITPATSRGLVRLDPLSAVMILVVGGTLGCLFDLVHAGNGCGFARFFYLNLFASSC
jgi:hypothetical protein